MAKLPRNGARAPSGCANTSNETNEYFDFFGIVKQPLRVEGEVLVIEGAPGFVTAGTDGSFGIIAENQVAVVQEVLSQYPDRFDTVTMFLSFTDANNMGTAYYQGVRNVVTGIGRSTYNSRRTWGLPPRGGRFSGFAERLQGVGAG